MSSTLDSLEHTAEFRIRSSEINANKQIKISSLVQLLQEASMQHVIKIGLSAWDLANEEISWVLLRKSINIKRLPNLHDLVRIVTKPTGFDRIMAYRDYLMYDESGVLIASASSTWILMSLTDRKMVGIPKEMLSIAHPDKDSYLPRSSKFRLPKVMYTQQYATRVAPSDLDWNGHVNNIQYLKWINDGISLDNIQGQAANISLQYVGEAFLNDDIICESAEMVDNVSYHRVKATASGQTLAEAKIEWS